MTKLKEGYTVLPPGYRWKGREATWATYGNYVDAYRKAVKDWIEAGKPEEELPTLAKLSLKCDAVWLYLTDGRILEGFGMPVKPDIEVTIELGDEPQLRMAV